MPDVKRLPLWLVSLFALAVAVPTLRAQDDEAAVDEEETPVKKDVPYVPTPQEVVDKMLELADPKEGEVMYDLGCGDGRIVVTAAKKYKAKGTGVDIDPQRIKESKANAKKAGLKEDQAKFLIKDLFEMDFKDADFLTLYLLPAVNERLRPQILEMRPGSRIVSHAFSMGDWEADEEVTMDPGGQTIYFWVVPAKVEGSHTVKLQGAGGKAQDAKLDLKQKYQMVTGTATIGGKKVEIADGRLRGNKLSFTAGGQKYTATIGGDAAASVAGSKEAGGDDEAARPAGERAKGKAGKSAKPQPKDEEADGDAAAGDTATEEPGAAEPKE
jgi:SAM-dependent methyltransferase